MCVSQDLMALTNVDTPLKGGANTPLYQQQIGLPIVGETCSALFLNFNQIITKKKISFNFFNNCNLGKD